jgi:large conductance mechanosensitive channel
MAATSIRRSFEQPIAVSAVQSRGQPVEAGGPAPNELRHLIGAAPRLSVFTSSPHRPARLWSEGSKPMDTRKELHDVKKRAFSLFDEFKKFAFKGNVVDLAIGVIIGTAFGAIVKSLVDDLIMPLVGLFLPGEKGYQSWVWEVGGKVIPYGKFLGAVVNFLIVAFVLYIFIVKFLGWVMRSKEASPPPPTKDQELLTEIRDLLKQNAPGQPTSGGATVPEQTSSAAPGPSV